RICAYLDALSVPGGGDMAIAADTLSHLVDEAPAHAMDEEDDLFPLLRRRAQPEDDLEATLSRLDGDHEHGRRLAEIVKPILATMARNGCASVGDRRGMLALLAGHERRHLIVENAIVLPLAAARLTPSDLRTLSLRMAARRGLDLAALEAGNEGVAAGA
ncbi:MAG: hemerythrin domain-containing protein, partial [Alphaproteobacteria bacterium]